MRRRSWQFDASASALGRHWVPADRSKELDRYGLQNSTRRIQRHAPSPPIAHRCRVGVRKRRRPSGLLCLQIGFPVSQLCLRPAQDTCACIQGAHGACCAMISDCRMAARFLDPRSRNIPLDLESRLFRKLQMIDDATTDRDLRVPPSNHF